MAGRRKTFSSRFMLNFNSITRIAKKRHSSQEQFSFESSNFSPRLGLRRTKWGHSVV